MKSKIFMTLLIFLGLRALSLSQEARIKEDKYLMTGLESSNYKKLEILVEGLPSDARKIGLTRKQIETKCELRLRQAGIIPTDITDPYKGVALCVSISVVNQAFSIRLSLNRLVYFEVMEKFYSKNLVPTWESEILGTHGGKSRLIIDSLDGLLDKFLNEYLKVNQKWEFNSAISLKGIYGSKVLSKNIG